MSDRSTVAVEYDGEQLANHEMRVEDLAPALLGFADAFRAAWHEIDPDAKPLDINIVATKPGSFGLLLAIAAQNPVMGILQDVGEFLTGMPTTAVVNAAALVTVVISAIGAVKQRRGRKVSTSEALPDNKTQLTLEDGDKLTLDTVVASLCVDPRFLNAINAATKPVDAEGIDEVKVINESHTKSVEVTKRDRPFFDPNYREPVEYPVTTRSIFAFTESPDWTNARMWRFNDGSGQFYARMEAPELEGLLNSGTRFGPADRVHMELAEQQSEDTSGKLKTTRTVTHVFGVRDGGTQDSLDLNDVEEA